MATTIGNVNYNLGKEYKLFCTELTVSNLLSYNGDSAKIPNNSIIISSPLTTEGNDIGTPAIVMSDYKSYILPITYTMNSVQFNVSKNSSENVLTLNTNYLTDIIKKYGEPYLVSATNRIAALETTVAKLSTALTALTARVEVLEKK